MALDIRWRNDPRQDAARQDCDPGGRPKFQPFATFDPPPWQFESSSGALPNPSPAAIATMFEEAASIPPAAWAALATVTVPNRLFGVEINHEGDAI